MNFEKFEKLIDTSYKDGFVSKQCVNGINAICQDFKIKQFVVDGYNTNNSNTLLFHGASKQGFEKLKKQQPKLTIIVPTYNRAEFLQRCVDSILEQTYQNIEVVIVDDCSTDGTKDVVKQKYGKNKKVVYVLNEKNLGPGGNRQKAYLMMTGEYVIFADDDDYYFEPTFFEKALAVFMEYDNLSMVCANSVIFDDIKKEFSFYPLTFCGVMKKEQFFWGFGAKYRKPNSTFPAVFKKSVLDKADFANMKMMNDTSIYMRAACFGDVCMLKDWVGVYWLHETNISRKLPFNFILENLDEKNNIYELAKSEFKKSNAEWLLTQQMITIKYFLNSERLPLCKFLKLKKWIAKNGGEVKKELKKETSRVYWYPLKTKIKKILRKK